MTARGSRGRSAPSSSKSSAVVLVVSSNDMDHGKVGQINRTSHERRIETKQATHFNSGEDNDMLYVSPRQTRSSFQHQRNHSRSYWRRCACSRVTFCTPCTPFQRPVGCHLNSIKQTTYILDLDSSRIQVDALGHTLTPSLSV